jgi:hypothetical protein
MLFDSCQSTPLEEVGLLATFAQQPWECDKHCVREEDFMTYTADIILTPPPLAVRSFIPTVTPGDVAVCLCGGGSRAMTAGMGQLLALETVLGGTASLLSQTKMLSTVSGGSWVGVPFTFLTPGTSDTAFLGGPYIAPGSLTEDGLLKLVEGCVASGITDGFTAFDLAAEAVFLYTFDDVPEDMLWQVLIGQTFLHPYDLFVKDDALPVSYFAYDQTAVTAIQKANPGTSLATEKPDMVAQVTGQSRPFLLCNMSMSVDPGSPNEPNPGLVPVQSTPFFTGIMSTPGVVDVNGRAVGGGGVSSFAFNSSPVAVNGSTVSIEQSRQWSLVDIIGTSSAAFAASLVPTVKDFVAHPTHFAAALRSNRDAILRHLATLGLDKDKAATIIDDAVSAVARGDIEAHRANLSLDLEKLVPSYLYWSPIKVPLGEEVKPSFFDDGGSLDNTGVASALSYEDIANLIVFVNSVTPLTQVTINTETPPEQVIQVDDMIPPLFGYQPFDSVQGYVPYSQPLVWSTSAAFANNQVFPSDQFPVLLQGLWAASGSGSFKYSPIFTQSLTTLPNGWFGVVGNTTVKVLWVYLENTVSWSNDLSSAVKQIESKLISELNFPHYDTFSETELTPTEINLLANLTAWTVMNNAAAFQAMYE